MILPYPPYTYRAQNTPRPYSNFFRPYIAFFFQFFSAFCGGCRMQCPWGSFTLLRVCLAGEFRFGIRGFIHAWMSELDAPRRDGRGIIHFSKPNIQNPNPKIPKPEPLTQETAPLSLRGVLVFFWGEIELVPSLFLEHGGSSFGLCRPCPRP